MREVDAVLGATIVDFVLQQRLGWDLLGWRPATANDVHITHNYIGNSTHKGAYRTWGDRYRLLQVLQIPEAIPWPQ